MRRFSLLFCSLFWLTVPWALAHHGQEFLIVQDAATPDLWSGAAFASFEWGKYGSSDELSIEPGFMLGVAPQVSLGATTSFIDEGDDGWKYQSLSPYVHLQLTPSTWPVRVALLAGYEFADRSAEIDLPAATAATPSVSSVKSTRSSRNAPVFPAPAPAASSGTGSTTDPGSGGGDPVICGPEYGPDAPACEDEVAKLRVPRHAGHTTPEPAAPAAPAVVTASPSRPSSARKATAVRKVDAAQPKPAAPAQAYDGIHRHGENHAFTRLIVEADLTARDKAIVNLIGIWPDDGKPAWGYAAGWRHSFSHEWAAGIEATGDFEATGEHELVVGAYWSPTHSATLKLGVGTGLTDISPDLSLRTGLVWRF